LLPGIPRRLITFRSATAARMDQRGRPWWRRGEVCLGRGILRAMSAALRDSSCQTARQWSDDRAALRAPRLPLSALAIGARLDMPSLPFQRESLIAASTASGRACKLPGMFTAFPNGIKVIYADPPWEFRTYSDKGKGRSAEQHYDCMSLDDIKALPVGNLAAKDCALFLWTTFPHLVQALAVIDAWGFTYKSGATWVKRTRNGKKWAMGCGYWWRGNPELLLLATRGKIGPRKRGAGGIALIETPRREHSRKPDEAYEQALLDPRLRRRVWCCLHPAHPGY
jgi:N6-adenosine-specific RNA methylase IME4